GDQIGTPRISQRYGRVGAELGVLGAATAAATYIAFGEPRWMTLIAGVAGFIAAFIGTTTCAIWAWMCSTWSTFAALASMSPPKGRSRRRSPSWPSSSARAWSVISG